MYEKYQDRLWAIIRRKVTYEVFLEIWDISGRKVYLNGKEVK